MNTHSQTDGWIYRTMILPGLIVLVSAGGGLLLPIMNRSVPETFIALGAVAAGGLAKLLIPTHLS